MEDTPTDVAVASIYAMATGDSETFHRLIHPQASNRESAAEPMDCRGTGPMAFAATSRWLREAWSDLAFTVDLCIAQDDVVVTHGTMSGRHTVRSSCTTKKPESSRSFLPPRGPSP